MNIHHEAYYDHFSSDHCQLSINSPGATCIIKIVGYYSLKAAMSDPDTKSFKYLTHINLWFFNPDTLGHFTQDLAAITPFIRKAHKRNIKVLFSLGGGSKQSQYHRFTG
ncbi:MAG: hypothetical protein IPK94_06010 [Saprospiraceae bacterium]|nr:hypothetical protein [Saprospiraceae bacterium]